MMSEPPATTTTNAVTRQERRLRSVGYLKSLGVERTTAVLIVGMAVLLFAFFSIIGSEGPSGTEADPESTSPAESLADS